MLIPLMFLGPVAYADDDEEVSGGGFELEPEVLIQLWATAYDQDVSAVSDVATYGDPEDDPGLKVRRAYVGLEGERGEGSFHLVVGTAAPFDGLHGDLPTDTVRMIDATLGVEPYEGAEITLGLQKVPVGREQLISSEDLALSERMVSSEWLVPGRDLGLVGDWSFGPGRFRAGVFNGGGDTLSDLDSGKLLTGRLELATGVDEDDDDAAYETYGKVDGTVFGLGVDGGYNDQRAINTALAGGDVIVRSGILSVLLEGRFAHIAPGDTSVSVPGVLAPTTRLGGGLQVGTTLGRWEPAVRASYFDDDTNSDDNGDLGEATGGLSWHGDADGLSAGAVYVLRVERKGIDVPNDTARLWVQFAL